jgi:hypothetical protein
VARSAGHARLAGMLSVNAAMRCVESPASLETQFGDAGHGASLKSLIPRFVGRVPAQENNGITITATAMIRCAAVFTLCNLPAQAAQAH